jgi:hypothetical protein
LIAASGPRQDILAAAEHKGLLQTARPITNLRRGRAIDKRVVKPDYARMVVVGCKIVTSFRARAASRKNRRSYFRRETLDALRTEGRIRGHDRHGNSRICQHQGTCQDQHQFRSRHHASFRSMRTNCAEREASDVIDMAGGPDIWLNRSFGSRRRNEDGVTLDYRMQDAQPLISRRVKANHTRWLFEYSPAAQPIPRGTYGSSRRQRARLQAHRRRRYDRRVTRLLRYCLASRQALRPTGSPSDILGPRLSSK